MIHARDVLLVAVLISSLFPGTAIADGPVSNDQATKVRPLLLQVSAAGAEEGKLRAVVTDVGELLASERLWHAFDIVAADYPEIYVGPEYPGSGPRSGYADPTGAKAFLRLRTPNTRVFSAIIGLTGTYYSQGDDYLGKCSNSSGTVDCRGTAVNQNYSNRLAVTHGLGKNGPDGFELVSIEIGREIFRRYDSASVEKRSCTYNTVAHEWVHTIGKDQSSHWALSVDSGSRVPNDTPLLTYLFGSLVQCHWLQGQGAVNPTDVALKACVRQYGVEQFLSLQCDD